MELDHAQARGSIPRRLSRLPTAHGSASNDTLKTAKATPQREDRGHESPSRSGLPRPSGNHQQRASAPSPSPLGESINLSVKSRFGWFLSSSQNGPKHSPTSDDFSLAHETTLEATPPSSTVNAYAYETSNENPVSGGKYVVDENSTPRPTGTTEKKRPRLSLSDKTIE